MRCRKVKEDSIWNDKVTYKKIIKNKKICDFFSRHMSLATEDKKDRDRLPSLLQFSVKRIISNYVHRI